MIGLHSEPVDMDRRARASRILAEIGVFRHRVTWQGRLGQEWLAQAYPSAARLA